MDDNDDLSAYLPLIYWSAESFDIDLKSYGKNATINYNGGNKKNNKNNVKKLMAGFLQRRLDLFYNTSKHRTNVSSYHILFHLHWNEIGIEPTC